MYSTRKNCTFFVCLSRNSNTYFVYFTIICDTGLLKTASLSSDWVYCPSYAPVIICIPSLQFLCCSWTANPIFSSHITEILWYFMGYLKGCFHDKSFLATTWQFHNFTGLSLHSGCLIWLTSGRNLPIVQNLCSFTRRGRHITCIWLATKTWESNLLTEEILWVVHQNVSDALGSLMRCVYMTRFTVSLEVTGKSNL